MRCFLKLKGRVAAVEFSGPYATLIEQAKQHFDRRGGEEFDGFELWDRGRCVFDWPVADDVSTGPKPGS